MLGIKLESQSLFLFFFSHSYATVKDNNFKCSNVLKALIALAEVFYFELKSVKILIWQRRYRAIILAVTQNMKKILTLIWVITLLSLTDKIAFMPYWALAPEAPKSCWLPAQGRQLAGAGAGAGAHPGLRHTSCPCRWERRGPLTAPQTPCRKLEPPAPVSWIFSKAVVEICLDHSWNLTKCVTSHYT